MDVEFGVVVLVEDVSHFAIHKPTTVFYELFRIVYAAYDALEDLCEKTHEFLFEHLQDLEDFLEG